MKRTLLILMAIFTLWNVADAQKVKVINHQEFYDYISQSSEASAAPAVFDFNATWCGPCRMLAPILEELAEEYKGRVNFYSIDVDNNKDLAKNLKIRSIPYVLFFKNGASEPEIMVGLSDKVEIKATINKILTK